MWDDHRMLNGIADWVYALALLLILYGALMLIIRLPVFPIHEVVVTGSIAHTTRDQVLDIVSGRLKGNFFTQDLEQARLAFEKLPWVRHASLRRQWPDRLFVEIEEHVAIARWRDAALVNSFGEVFEAASGERLPVFLAPVGTSAEVTQRYEEFSRLLAPLGRRLVQISLSERRAWELMLDDGTVLELGREDLQARLQRYAACARALARPPAGEYRVDLRYANGFAVRALDHQPRLQRSGLRIGSL
ncbi:MAG TPA: cell division protein FtsQ/DivIB [Burkholderiales bacterium]|nr:cell division protein FtsQ/DivIB [Burkholderiales bacterium]